MLLQGQEPLQNHGIAKRLWLRRLEAQRQQRGAQELDDTSNVLHKACGGWQLLSGAPKGFGAPTGEGRIEDFQRIGPENRLKVLAAEKTCSEIHEGAPLALHMLCANPHVSVDAVKFVGNLYPAAAAIPTSKYGGGETHKQWSTHAFEDALPLHLLCLNKSVTAELVGAVAALYPAALDAGCTEYVGGSNKGLFGNGPDYMYRRWKEAWRSAPLKPLDLLKVTKPSIVNQCSKLVGRNRKSPEKKPAKKKSPVKKAIVKKAPAKKAPAKKKAASEKK